MAFVGSQRGHPLLLSPLPLPLSSEGFPKGRAAARPFVSFQGGAGGNRNPPAFLFRGPGGHSLFKREYPPGFSVPNRYSSAGNPGNLFGKTKRKWGFNPVRHSRTFPNQSGALGVSKRKWGVHSARQSRASCGEPPPLYGSSRISGILMHRGPPRPRLSSALGMAWMRMPASSKERLVTWFRV